MLHVVLLNTIVIEYHSREIESWNLEIITDKLADETLPLIFIDFPDELWNTVHWIYV